MDIQEASAAIRRLSELAAERIQALRDGYADRAREILGEERTLTEALAEFQQTNFHPLDG